MRAWGALLLLAALLGDAGRSEAACKLVTVVELSIEDNGGRLLTPVRINGTDARFIVDSGSEVSLISPATAKKLNLPLSASSLDREFEGIGGSFNTVVRQVDQLSINGTVFHNVPFVVGGSDVESAAVGLIGQNVLRIADVDYDVAHKVIRLMRPQGCETTSLAYWDGGRAASSIPIESTDETRRHTVGAVTLNGVRLRAIFDTGAPYTVLNLRTAARLGLRPDSPGVVAAGETHGLGRNVTSSWKVPVELFEIGGATIKHTHMLMGELDPDSEIIVGLDFFRAHHIFVATSQDKLYFSYQSGPAFGPGE